MLRLPLTYPVRSLLRRPLASLLTVLAVAAVVLAATVVAALARGVEVRQEASGEPRNLLLISRKGQDTMFSAIEADELVHLAQLPGLAAGPDGLPLLSPELHHVALVRHAGRDAPVQVRGVGAAALDVHPRVRLLEGRLPECPFEALAGATLGIRLGRQPAVGDELAFENQDWRIVGRFAAGGGLHEGELWVRIDDLQAKLRRRSWSLAVARMASASAAQAALAEFARPGPVERSFKGWVERDYYRQASGAIAWLAWVVRLLLGAVLVAGAAICVNTMLAAVQRRRRELDTLRLLGFGRGEVAAGLALESFALALAGGLLGLGAAALLSGRALALDQNAFLLTVDGPVAAIGLGLAAAIGACGALACRLARRF